MIKQDKEIKKLTWMKKHFILECKKMLKLIEQQELKIHKTEKR